MCARTDRLMGGVSEEGYNLMERDVVWRWGSKESASSVNTAGYPLYRKGYVLVLTHQDKFPCRAVHKQHWQNRLFHTCNESTMKQKVHNFIRKTHTNCSWSIFVKNVPYSESEPDWLVLYLTAPQRQGWLFRNKSALMKRKMTQHINCCDTQKTCHT